MNQDGRSDPGSWLAGGRSLSARADFLERSRGEERVPVVFSTAHVDGDRLKNARCFVFPEPHPLRERDKAKRSDLDF
jgi:hypothetical protein